MDSTLFGYARLTKHVGNILLRWKAAVKLIQPYFLRRNSIRSRKRNTIRRVQASLPSRRDRLQMSGWLQEEPRIIQVESQDPQLSKHKRPHPTFRSFKHKKKHHISWQSGVRILKKILTLLASFSVYAAEVLCCFLHVVPFRRNTEGRLVMSSFRHRCIHYFMLTLEVLLACRIMWLSLLRVILADFDTESVGCFLLLFLHFAAAASACSSVMRPQATLGMIECARNVHSAIETSSDSNNSIFGSFWVVAEVIAIGCVMMTGYITGPACSFIFPLYSLYLRTSLNWILPSSMISNLYFVLLFVPVELFQIMVPLSLMWFVSNHSITVIAISHNLVKNLRIDAMTRHVSEGNLVNSYMRIQIFYKIATASLRPIFLPFTIVIHCVVTFCAYAMLRGTLLPDVVYLVFSVICIGDILVLTVVSRDILTVTTWADQVLRSLRQCAYARRSRPGRLAQYKTVCALRPIRFEVDIVGTVSRTRVAEVVFITVEQVLSNVLFLLEVNA